MTKTNQIYSFTTTIGSNPVTVNITGQNMTVGQWDYSKPRNTHKLLTGKITYNPGQNQTISRHSTNIAGTIAGNNGEMSAKGIAYDATIKAFDWVDDVKEMTENAYSTNNASGILVANNSYGFDPMYLQTYQFGKYNLTAQSWDNLMYLKPYLQIVKAAGNARELNPGIVPQVSAKGGYDLLEGAGIAKNVLVIASAKKNTSMSTDEDYTVSAFSSYGPTDDGRIKPDLCAPGEEMYSSIETYDEAYGVYRGTSSATAVTSGIIALLQQYYKLTSPSSSYMQSATVRALLAHTANDKGFEGPDYIYGWGLVDAFRAATAIHDNIEGVINYEKKTTLIKELNLTQGNQYILYVVPLNASQPLSATIAWTDPQGNVILGDQIVDSQSPNLINDLDLKIVKVSSNGTETPYYPWKLGGMANRLSPATQGINNVDNIERVDIKNPEIITYKIIVSTKSKSVPLLPNGNQNFSLVVSNVDFCYMDDLRTLMSPTNDINVNTPQKIIKAKQIIASNVVKNPVQNVEYVASRNISLLPGFQAEHGSGFRAYITPCFDVTTSMLYKAQQRTGQNPTAPSDTVAESKYLASIFPNPAKEEVNIRFNVSSDSVVKISIHDQSGRLVLVNQSPQSFPKGSYLKTIDTSKFSSGVYVVSIETVDYKESKKLIIK